MKFVTTAAKNTLAARGLKYVLHSKLRRAEPDRSHKIVHASSLTQAGTNRFCPRRSAIMDKVALPNPPLRYLDTSMSMTFEIGRQVQDIVVNVLNEAGAAITNWKCDSCGGVTHKSMRPLNCGCGCRSFKPEEIRVRSSVSDISCGIDVFANLGEPKLRAVEIKTIAPEEFKKLIAPMWEHRVRTSLYLRCLAESDDPWKERVNTDMANVLYVSKGGYGTMDGTLAGWGIGDKFSPFKEFVIHRNDQETEPYVAQAIRLKKFRQGEAGMPCGICTTAFDKTAQACPVSKQCFSGAFTASEEVLSKGE